MQRPTGDAPAQPHAVPTDADGEAPPEASREGPRAPLAERVVEPVREGAPQTPRSALSRDALDATRTDPALEGEPRPVREPRHGSPSRAVDAPRRGHAARSGRDAAPEPARTLGPAQEDCLELARRGESRAAERCFDRRATGSGLGAEMALYEVARLRRDVLSDAVGALAALSAYRERFARGSLRNEVDLSRVELLADLGRSADALRESAALLGAASGRERAAELHQLRGDVYRRQLGDLRAAAAEYAQVEALGGARGAEASRSLGACLEGLGDIPGALAAYRRYVREPGRPHAAEIQRRIDRLGGSAPRSPSPR